MDITLEELNELMEQAQYDIVIQKVNQLISKQGGDTPYSLLKIEALLELEKFEKALEEISQLQKTTSLGETSIERLQIMKYESTVYMKTGKWDVGHQRISFAEEKFPLVDKDDNEKQKIVAEILRNRGSIYFYQGELEKSLEYQISAKEIFERIDDDEGLAKVHISLGNISARQGYLDLALDNYKIAETNLESKPVQKAHIWLNQGNIYYKMGKLDQAMGKYQASLKVLDKFNYTVSLKFCHFNLGAIHTKRGQLDTALDHYQLSLHLAKQLDSEVDIASNLIEIGRVLELQNNIDAAREHYQEALNIVEDTSSLATIINTLGKLVEFEAEHDVSKAENYLNKLKETIKDVENNTLRIKVELSEITYLMRSKRRLQLAKAEKRLDKMLNAGIPFVDSHITALTLKCELLLLELHTVKEIDIIEELDRYLDLIYKLGRDEKIYPYQIQAMHLRSKLYRLQGEFSKALDLLEEAIQIATDHNLGYLLKMLEEELDDLKEEMRKMKELVEDNRSLFDKLDQNKLENYISMVQNLR